MIEPDDSFEKFWSMYPRKVAKADARKAWKALTEEQKFAAIESLPIHVRYWNAAGTGKEFTPYPATWCRGERWEDELEMPTPTDSMGEWWKSTAGIQKKAQAVGVTAKPGEDWMSLKARILAKEKAA